MNSTLLDTFCAEEMLKAMHDYKVHLKSTASIPKMLSELEAIGIKVIGCNTTVIDTVEYCRYSKKDELCVVYSIPFSRRGSHVTNASIVIKQFVIPATNPRYPDRKVFEMFLKHDGRLRTCELQNGARWW